MAKFRVKTQEVRVYEVIYEIEAEDLAGAKKALEVDGGTGDDDVGEILRESPTFQSVQSVQIGPIKKIA